MNILQVSRGIFSKRFAADVDQKIAPGELFEVLKNEDKDIIEPLRILDWGAARNESDSSAIIKEVKIGDVYIGIGDGKIAKVGSRNTVNVGIDLPLSEEITDANRPAFVPSDEIYEDDRLIDISSNIYNKTPGTLYTYTEKGVSLFIWGHPTKYLFLNQGDMIYFGKPDIIDGQETPTSWIINNSYDTVLHVDGGVW